LIFLIASPSLSPAFANSPSSNKPSPCAPARTAFRILIVCFSTPSRRQNRQQLNYPSSLIGKSSAFIASFAKCLIVAPITSYCRPKFLRAFVSRDDCSDKDQPSATTTAPIGLAAKANKTLLKTNTVPDTI
jgi:hypothetical protein